MTGIADRYDDLEVKEYLLLAKMLNLSTSGPSDLRAKTPAANMTILSESKCTLHNYREGRLRSARKLMLKSKYMISLFRLDAFIINGIYVKPLTHLDSKWPLLIAMCSLQGVASSSWKLQQLQHVSYNVFVMV